MTLARAPLPKIPTPLREAVTRLSTAFTVFDPPAETKIPLFPLPVTWVSDTNSELAAFGAKLMPELANALTVDFWMFNDAPETN